MLPFRVSRPLCDIGLFSDNAAMPEFYEHELGLPYVDVIQHSPTYQERFYEVHGASLKINYTTDAMRDGTSGYRGLTIARSGARQPSVMSDPDGLVITVVPPGTNGVSKLGVVIAVPDAATERRFYIDAIGAREDDHGLLVNDTRIVIEQSAVAAEVSPTWRRGFNYILVPVDDTALAHRHALEHGATHGLRPIRLAERCVFSWLRAPSGNWIEFVQYTDTGPLPDIPRADSLWPEIIAWHDSGTPA